MRIHLYIPGYLIHIPIVCTAAIHEDISQGITIHVCRLFRFHQTIYMCTYMYQSIDVAYRRSGNFR